MAWSEVLAKRGATSRIYQDSETRQSRFESVLKTRLHYASVLDSDALDATVDMTPVRVDNAQFDGWVINSAPWRYALGQPADKATDGWVGFGGRHGSHWVKFRLARMAWYQSSTKVLTEIGGAPTYNRVNLSSDVRTLTIGPNDDEIVAGSTHTWADIWPEVPNGQVDVSWHAEGRRLKEEVSIDGGAQTTLRNQYPGGPAVQQWLAMVFQMDWSDVPRRVIDGIVTPADDESETDGEIELRDAADNLLALMPIDYLYVRDPVTGETLAREPLRRRFWKDGDNHYLLVGIRADVLNALPEGTWIFDPTFDSQPAEAAGIDTFITANATTTNYGTDGGWITGYRQFFNIYRGLLKWDLSSIDAGVTVDSAEFSAYHFLETSANTTNHGVYRMKRAWVESEATWEIYSTGNSWGASGGFDSTDCEQTDIGYISMTASESNGTKSWTLDTDSVSEWIDGDFTNNGFMVKCATEPSGGSGQNFYSSGNATESNRPRLVIEYSEGGEAQTVTLSLASLTGTAKSSSVSPGAVSVVLAALSLAGTAKSTGVSPGAIAVTLDALTLAGTAKSAGVLPGAVAIVLDALTLAGAAKALTVSPGAVTTALDALTLTGSAPSLSIAATVSVVLDALSLAVTAKSATVSPGAVSVVLDALTLAGSAPGLTVSPGSIAVVLDALSLAGSAPALSVSPGAVAIALDALSLIGTAGSLSASNITAVALSLITLSSAAPAITVSPGAVAVSLDLATLDVSVLDIRAISECLADVTLADAAVTTLTIGDTVVTRLTTANTAVYILSTDDSVF